MPIQSKRALSRIASVGSPEQKSAMSPESFAKKKKKMRRLRKLKFSALFLQLVQRWSKNKEQERVKNQRKQNKHYNASNKKNQRHRHIISEDYDIEEVSGDTKKQNNNDHNDDQRFNTEEHHKKQHKF